MKPQFTYSLDEAKIRKQLQDLKPGNAEEAWQKFAQFADAQPRPITSRKMPVIKLNVDRRIVVPAAAAIVIVVIAVLLFNFIDLKKSSKTNTQKAVVAEPFVPMPQVSEAETIIPEKQEPLEAQLAENNKGLMATKPEVVTDKTGAPLAPDKNEPVTSANNAKTSQPGTPEPQTTQAVVKKKKADVAPLEVPELRPSLLTDEQVDDIRPN